MSCVFLALGWFMCGESCSCPRACNGAGETGGWENKGSFSKAWEWGMWEWGKRALKDGSGKLGLGQPGSLPKQSGEQTGS